MAASVYDFEAESLDGRRVPLGDFRGEALLIVNVASKCGFPPQYAGLQALQDAYGPGRVSVRGCPCIQFGAQEPGGAEDIRAFLDSRYAVTFPMFAKVEVNGPGAHPLYEYLKRARPGFLGLRRIKWNFTKFLIDRQGRPVRRFGPTPAPERIAPAIKELL